MLITVTRIEAVNSAVLTVLSDDGFNMGCWSTTARQSNHSTEQRLRFPAGAFSSNTNLSPRQRGSAKWKHIYLDELLFHSIFRLSC